MNETLALAAGNEPVVPCDPNADAADVPRLSKQCLAILERLKRGRATNADLVIIALKYTGRISDLRKAGYDIRVVDKDAGTFTYALFLNNQEILV